MPMYNLLEHTKKYPETSESFWQYNQKELPIERNDRTNENSESFIFKLKYTGNIVTDLDDATNWIKNSNNSLIKIF